MATSNLFIEEIPENLRTQEMLEAWEEWVEVRREMRKPVTRRSARINWRRIARMSPGAALAALEWSASARYQGVYPDPLYKEDPAKQDVGQKKKTLSTWEAKEKLQACKNRLEEMLYPGGCAHAVTLQGERAEEAQRLRDRIRELKAIIRA